ncbi:MAG TPA: Ig domain-containing protein, partial [bacterium]|nr:Ig domain-containing protein [bacterium]
MCVSVSPLRAAVLAFMSLVLVSCGGGSSPTAPSGQQAGGDLDINLRPLAARQNSPIIPIEIQIPPTDAEDDIPAYIHIGYRIGLGGSQPLRLMTAAAGTLDLNNRNTIVDIPPDGRELVFFWDALEDLGPDADLDTVVIRAGILRANGSPAREAVCDFQPVIRVNFGATADCPTDAPMLEGERLDPATVGVPYQDRIEAEGGEPPLRYELINRETGEPTGTNSLGFGLFLNETTGEITGTPTAGAPELLTFVVRVTDSCGDDVNTGQRTGQQAALPEGRFDQAQFELPITGGQPVECEADPPAITTTELPDGTQGEPYDFQLEATGGEGTLAWSGEGFTGAGLSVDPNGRIGGTPNTFGTFSVTAIVRDACETPQEDRQSFILDIACAAPPSFATCGGEARMGQGVTACRLPDAFLGSVYSTTIAVNSPAGFDGFSVDGDLPAGLIVTTDATSGDASATLTISGTPTDEGQTGVDFLFELRIVDACGQERRQFYAIRLNPVSNCPEPGPQIENPTGTLPGGEAGSAYSAPITVTGGTPPVGPVTVVDGGGTNLTIGADGRTLEGTLPAEGTYTLVLAVSDACAPPRSDQETFTLTVFAPCTPLEITTTPPLPVGIVGSPYSVDLMASGGTGALTWALAPRSAPLPDGLTISAAGTISGTPTAAGTFDFRVRVED